MPAALIFFGVCAIFFSLAVPQPGSYLQLGIAGEGTYRPGEMVTVHWDADEAALGGRRVDIIVGLSEVEPPWAAGPARIEDIISGDGDIFVFKSGFIPVRWQWGMQVPVAKDVALDGVLSGTVFFIVTPEIAAKTLTFWAIFVDSETGQFINPANPVATSADFSTANLERPSSDDVSIDGTVAAGR